MDVVHNINEHALTHIAPSKSKYGEDGIGVFASTQIKAGTLLFQLPEGFSVGTVEVTGEEIKKYIYNLAALDFLKMRVIPHIESSMCMWLVKVLEHRRMMNWFTHYQPMVQIVSVQAHILVMLMEDQSYMLNSRIP